VGLDEPSPQDTAEYLAYRLERVGCKSSLFASDAVSLLHEVTKGQLRDLDRVATACLRAAATRNLKRVDCELLQSVVDADTNHH
jgi:type II secretory pathway predicted ATPase ExeA